MKLVIKKRKAADKFEQCLRYSNLSFQEYSDRIGKYTNRQIRSIYKEVFDRECAVNIVWAKYQIHYELARQMLIKSGQKISAAFKEHYLGTMKCDLSKTGETLKTLIPFELKYNDENSMENKMKAQNKANAIKKAVEVKKSKCIGITTGLSVYDAWVLCFKKNAKEHKPDEEITKFLLAEFPDHQIKSFYAVHACRINYNNGRYTKGVKPEVKSVKYNADGTEWKRARKADAKVNVKPAAAPKKAATATKKKAVIVKKSTAKKAK